jgi:AFG3 family protein
VAEELLEKEMLTRDDMVRILGHRKWESKGDFDKWFGGGPAKGADEGRGKNPGGIGDSESGGGPGPKLPPGLARGPDEEAAPSLFQQFEKLSKEWKQL